MTLRALIFDVDGTLADTEEAHREAFNAAFAAHAFPWRWSQAEYQTLLAVPGGKERLAHFFTTVVVEDDERAAAMARIPALHATKTARYTQAIAGGRVALRPGVERLLRTARERGIALAIATTTTPDNVHALLRGTLGSTAPGWFAVIAAGDMVARKKPAPDIYLYALDRLGCSAADCVAFEDSAHGLASATSAGLVTVVTPTRWSAGEDFAAADLVLPTLGDAARPLPATASALLAARQLEFAHLEGLLQGRRQQPSAGVTA